MVHAFASSRRLRPRSVVIALLVLLSPFLAPCALDAQGLTSVSTSVSPGEREAMVAARDGRLAHHPSRVLVRFRTGSPRDFLPGTPSSRALPDTPDLYVIENPPGLSVAEAVSRYRARPNVLYAEPDFVVEALATPTDPLWNQQWDMSKISCPAAWDHQTDSSSVIVAVIDTGIDFNHPDLAPNLWTEQGGWQCYDCFRGS